MIQNIIVLIVIFSAIVYVVFALYRNIRGKESNRCNCGCGTVKRSKVHEIK